MTPEYLQCLKEQEKNLREKIEFNKNYCIPISRKLKQSLKWIQEQLTNTIQF